VSRERAHLSELDRLFRSACDEATALRQHWCGTGHVLLALVASNSVAASALADLGVTHESLARALVDDVESDPSVQGAAEDEEWFTITPAVHELEGRSEGLAAGLGASKVRPEHVLIAYLWSPYTSVDLEEQFGITREAVLERLGALGVDLPRAPLPPRPLPLGARIFVPYERLMDVVHGVGLRLPPDSGIGFNHDGESRAWVSAHREIDLEHHVRAVLVELGVERGTFDSLNS
jgi:hypothetical protein